MVQFVSLCCCSMVELYFVNVSVLGCVTCSDADPLSPPQTSVVTGLKTPRFKYRPGSEILHGSLNVGLKFHAKRASC